MGQIVRFEMDEPETAGVQTQQPLPIESPINLTDEEERMSRDSNAEIRHKAHQALDSLMHGNARFRKVLITASTSFQCVDILAIETSCPAHAVSAVAGCSSPQPAAFEALASPERPVPQNSMSLPTKLYLWHRESSRGVGLIWSCWRR